MIFYPQIFGCLWVFHDPQFDFHAYFPDGVAKKISNYSDGGFEVGDSRWVSVVMKNWEGIPVPPHEELQNLCQK